MPKKIESLWDILEKAEKKALQSALEKYNNLPRAAIALGIDHTTLYKKALKHGLIKKGERPPGAKFWRSPPHEKVSSPFDWAAPPDEESSELFGNDSPTALGPSWLIEAARRK